LQTLPIVLPLVYSFLPAKPDQPMKELYDPELDFYLLIPYYNNLPGLVRSLQSISYDPARYALLIVDDGSKEILLEADLSGPISALPGIEIIRLPENKGITKALNAGLNWLEGKKNFRYVARLDCGDVCAANRFTRQVAFLDQHPEIDLVGSWCLFKDFSTGEAYQYRTPVKQEAIARGMYFRNIFIHPTVIWRSAVMKKIGLYPENFPHAEDYGFFCEILSKGKATVIPEDLVIAEINHKGLSLKFRKEQLRSRAKVVRQYGKNGLLRRMGIIKLYFLRVIPYGLILKAKRLIYGIKILCVI
jgi:glycosyltransferase involved in cell wall biosynthesis